MSNSSHDAAHAGLCTLADLIRWGAAELRRAGVLVGHSEDNPLDEARALVLHALHLPHESPASFAQARLLDAEIDAVCALFRRRIDERVPAAYLIGRAQFAGIELIADPRALVPRSPIAELIETGFQPWLGERPVTRVLDLCCGGGSIAIATALRHPHWQVSGADLSAEALSLAAENRALHRLDHRLRLVESNLFDALGGEIYDLIVSNPPYITEAEYTAMPDEYRHEPKLGLTSGTDGCDACLRILRDASAHLCEDGLLIVEVGEAERALRRLLPELPLAWIRFSVGPMGVFAVAAGALRRHAAAIADLCAARGV
ncbi:MAG: 50S ribosomal protein L3 N(5)-glutamine methyltransferase [Xanthomonadales bacterium]|nr:50S ribosomal protein L3 glutamine methyltransferase [Xanthomonadales bacterium]MCC6592623.1 50S ribosomal protein L3 N(5)-glutamine methyltransferase [Xanthomonadales bacterium]MCE7931963.1 50S ribosomal protein L3 N(5)-glutamine methyltransferase [Xanthomonadales bacterium PRO6]